MSRSTQAKFCNQNDGRGSRNIERNVWLCPQKEITLHRSVNGNDSKIKQIQIIKKVGHERAIVYSIRKLFQ